MSNNYQGGGVNIGGLIAPAGGVTSGLAVKIGSLIVVANDTAAAAAEFTGIRGGIWDHAKVSAQVWAVGDKIYWDDTAKLMTTVSTSNTLVGVAIAIAANPTATGMVLMTGQTV